MSSPGGPPSTRTGSDPGGRRRIASPWPTSRTETRSSLPAPAADHYYLALILYSWTNEIGAPENEIVQGSTAGFPNNACISAPMFSQCAR